MKIQVLLQKEKVWLINMIKRMMETFKIFLIVFKIAPTNGSIIKFTFKKD